MLCSRLVAIFALLHPAAFPMTLSAEPSRLHGSDAASGAGPPVRPARILSINLCADQLLLQLVERERIVGVSSLASDPELSALSERARGLPLTGTSAEEIVLRRPDLALVGHYWMGEAVETLRRMGVPVVEIWPAESFEDVREQLSHVARAVGAETRANDILRAFDSELEALRARRPARAPRAAFAQPDGSTSGKGTLADAILAAAGFDNLPARLGLQGFAALDLERLLLESPELLVRPSYHAEAPTLGRDRARHPALARSGAAELSVPYSLLVCGTTESLRAVRALVEWRERQGRAP